MVSKVQVVQALQKLEQPELCFQERALLAHQLREAFATAQAAARSP